MGLSAPKKRTRIAADPNNTTWSKSTDGFGHKILTAQGWTPGQLLGAKNAAHAEHFTAANASHIRVMLREDNLGLGAQLGKSNAETFGLSTLSGIFGRLNGKSDKDVEKAQSAQRDAELRAYQTHKFGHMTFVRGGLLVGDKMEPVNELVPTPKSKENIQKDQQQAFVVDAVHDAKHSDKKNKRKRKSDGSDEGKDETSQKRTKKSKNESIKKIKTSDERDTNRNGVTRSRSDLEAPASTAVAGNGSHLSDKSTEKATQKAAKAALKAAKLERKEARALRRAARQQRSKCKDKSASTEVMAPPVNNDRNSAASNSFAGSRQAVRQRWIQQKRLASMDPRALNEILMLKTAVT